MLPIIILGVRAVLQLILTFAPAWLAEATVLPIINKSIEDLMVKLGVSEEQAKDIMSNEILMQAEEIGIAAATLRTKLPLKIVEKLGFTTKGFSLRVLTGQVGSKVAAASETAVAAAVKGAEDLAASFGLKAAAKGAVATVGKSLGDFLFKTVGLSLGFLYVLGNFLDFAAWPGSAFQNTAQAFFKIFGLNPDQSSTNSKVLSNDMWKKIWNVYKTLGATGIKNPETGETLIFSADNLILVADKIAAQIIAENGKVTTQQMIFALQGLMILSAPITDSKLNNIISGAETTPGGEEIKITGTGAKVFTGVVSQGVLGTQSEFTAREDDLIESQDELQVAAQNNLAAFLTALPGKARYELKIVNTVTLKDGTKKYGTSQQIVTGKKKDGTLKYKTVKNKFAVLDIYIFTDRNVRSKISQIILGPTDSIKLNPTLKALADMAATIQQNIIVEDTKEIETISQTITQQPTQTTSPVSGATVEAGAPFWGNATDSKTGKPIKLGPFNTMKESIDAMIKYQATASITPGTYVEKPTTPATTTPATTGTETNVQIPTSTNPNKCNAQSIAEFFDPNKITYPSVATRAKLYEAFGLGLEAYYTGTSEQNTKLLAELKKRVGCAI